MSKKVYLIEDFVYDYHIFFGAFDDKEAAQKWSDTHAALVNEAKSMVESRWQYTGHYSDVTTVELADPQDTRHGFQVSMERGTEKLLHIGLIDECPPFSRDETSWQISPYLQDVQTLQFGLYVTTYCHTWDEARTMTDQVYLAVEAKNVWQKAASDGSVSGSFVDGELIFDTED